MGERTQRRKDHITVKTILPNFSQFQTENAAIAVVGLGYVGLPLALLFAKRYRVWGFDISATRIEELKVGLDRTKESTAEQLADVLNRRNAVDSQTGLSLSADPRVLNHAKFIIVTVPTPIDRHKIPDLSPLQNASALIGRNLRRGATIVYESTVYPGCTEEDCIPIIERESGLVWKADFHVGYSPERINPGDKDHTVAKIKKVVAGDSPETTDLVKAVYSSVITAGVYVAASIKTAEAAKVIENTQRDLNIALMNELALIFDRLGLNTLDVLEAAGTKWNFLPFRPGLVGGHCIGVDPYYLTHKAQSIGFHPEMILAGRRINDRMSKEIAEKAIKLMLQAGKTVRGGRLLILGFTFKENIPDIRNTKVIDIYHELVDYGVIPTIFDPHASACEVLEHYGINIATESAFELQYEAVVLAVPHREFGELLTPSRICSLGGAVPPLFIDIKGMIPAAPLVRAGIQYWRL